VNMIDPPLVLPTREGYDRWAEIYDDEQNPLIEVEQSVVDRLVGDVAGLDVADVGCGTGRHAVRLAAAGARVVGVDFSGAMLARARAKQRSEGVTWIEHDLTRLPLPLPKQAFDRVLCALVLDHIESLPDFFAELRRVCRSDGRVVTTVMHPAMMLKGTQARFRDPRSGRETRPRSFANRIADYVNGALDAGLEIRQVGEVDVGAELAERMPRAQKYLGWPILWWMELAP